MFYPHHSNIPLICPINVPNIPTGSLTGSLPGVARRCWPSSMARCRGKETGVPRCYLKTIIQNQAKRQVSTLWWAHLFVQPETAFRATILWFEMMKYDITIYYMLINEHKSEMLKNHVGQNVCFLGWPSPPHPPGPPEVVAKTVVLDDSSMVPWRKINGDDLWDPTEDPTVAMKSEEKLRLSKDGRWW